MSDHDITQRIKVLIANRHTGDSRMRDWTVFFELRDGTGTGASGQSMDAFAMHTWPSKGYRRIGYEIKASRSDFIREMKAPEKRAWGVSITHEFWFVAPAKVIEPTEVPEDCGLLVITANGDRLRTAKVAPYRKPRDLTITEVAAIVRKAHRADLLGGARWKSCGREINDDVLTAIIEDERSRLETAEFDKRVEEAAREKTQKLYHHLKLYADALKSAGCAPPPWMLGESDSNFISSWSAETWVAENVTGGPGGREVRIAADNIRHALESIQRAERSMAALLKLDGRTRDEVPE